MTQTANLTDALLQLIADGGRLMKENNHQYRMVKDRDIAFVDSRLIDECFKKEYIKVNMVKDSAFIVLTDSGKDRAYRAAHPEKAGIPRKKSDKVAAKTRKK
jgi:hypothetical protein